MNKGLLQCVAVGLCMCCAPSITEARVDGSSVYDDVARSPQGVTFLVVVRDAAAMRNGPIGDHADALVRTMSDFARTTNAWQQLADQLGLTPGEAFDQLLGRRVVLFARDGSQVGQQIKKADQPWAIECVVSRETEARIRKRLRPAPRSLAGGVPILAVEDGAFELVIFSGNESSRVILGPTNSSTLFDELAIARTAHKRSALLHKKEPGVQRAIEMLRERSANPDACVLMRSGTAGNTWIMSTVSQEGAGFRARIVASAPEAADAIKAARPWSIEPVERLIDEQTYLVFVENIAMFSRVEGRSPHAWWVPSPVWRAVQESAQPDDGDGQAHHGGDALSARASGMRSAIVLARSAESPFELALAVETQDVARLARTGDRVLARLLSPTVDGGEHDDDAHDFGGVMPSAMRVVSLDNVLSGALADMWGENGQVAWNYLQTVDSNDANIPAITQIKKSGWWTMGLGQGLVERVSKSLSGTVDGGGEGAKHGGATVSYLAVLEAQPASLYRDMVAKRLPLPPPLNVFERMERIAVRVSAGPDGLIVGECVVLFSGARTP